MDVAAFREEALEDELPALVVGVTVLLVALVAREGVSLEPEDWPDVVIGSLFSHRLRFLFQL